MSTIKLKGSSSGEAEVTVAAAAGTPTFTLPTTVGSANQLLKNSGTAGTLEYSSNLTYDGSDLAVGAGNINVSKPAIPTVLVQNSTDTSYSTVKLQQSSGSGGYFAITKLGTNSSATGGANAAQLWQSGNAPIVVGVNNAEVAQFTTNGLKVPSGKGIDFSAQTASSTTGTTVGAELFDHYEEGTWTPIFMYYNSGWYNCAFSTSPETTNAGVYTRIGRVVYFSYYSNTAFDMSTGASNTAGLAGLPYAAASDQYYVISVSHDNCWEQAAQNGYVSYGSDKMVFTRENDHPAATWSGSSGRYLMVSGYYHV